MSLEIKPYNKAQSKSEEVREMFDSISPKYDLLNHSLTLGIDNLWRRRVVKMLRRDGAKEIIDVATGTGDLAILIKRKIEGSKVTGVDLSNGMLERARMKAVDEKVDVVWKVGDAENLEFAPDGSFDAMTVAFGVRNFENIPAALVEMRRVLKPRGSLVVLELTIPKNVIFRTLFKLYFFGILPLVGRMVSKDKRAYSYLPQSVEAFSEKIDFQAMLHEAGFKSVTKKSLTFGIATIFKGIK